MLDQTDPNVSTFHLEREKDRGVATSPAAADRLDHFLLAESSKTHRRVGGARQLERAPQIRPRERERKARFEMLYTGSIGTGLIAKIMHNSASFMLDLVMAECWTVRVKAGIDAATIVGVFKEP